MLQVKDPQEVFDEIVKSQMEESLKEEGRELPLDMLNSIYSIFVLGEMYGTISTCLAQNIPIPKKMWDMPVVKSFVRGDVDDVAVVNPNMTEEEIDNLQAETRKKNLESLGIILP